jgi:hypothetical protein
MAVDRVPSALAGLALGVCGVALVLAAGCNGLSGIDDFVVEGDAGPDRTVGEAAAATGAADAAADGDSLTETGADAAIRDARTRDAKGGEAAADSAPDALEDATASGTPDARADATPDAAADATGTDGCTVVTHSNGLGQAFYDCTPLGTRTIEEATAACIAYTGSASQCVNNPPACTTGSVCSSGAALCACWRYMGPPAGHVNNPVAACVCASGMDPTWQ